MTGLDQTILISIRQLHQRKQNYEIYKYLKFQFKNKTQEVKKLKEQERDLKKNKIDVRNLAHCASKRPG